MPLIVPLWMVTRSNINIYCCECVCFVSFYCLISWMYIVSSVVWCLLTCSIFGCSWCRDWISVLNVYLFIHLFIQVMGLNNNCSSLTVIIALPYVDYFFVWRSVRGYVGCRLYRGYNLLWICGAKIRIRWGMLQRTNAKTNSFCKKKLWYHIERGGKLSANVARANTWRVGSSRFD
jgi:hypothetical protein